VLQFIVALDAEIKQKVLKFLSIYVALAGVLC
jgi:hypothetical protein